MLCLLSFRPFITTIFIAMSFSSYTLLDNNSSSLEIGICTDYSHGNSMKRFGYSYIEEGVGKFLVPTKNEEEFKSIIKNAKEYPLPVKACNNFIPKELKSVGHDAVHDKILKYAETAFRRAQKTGVEIIVFGSGGSRSIPEGFSREKARQQFVELCEKMAPLAAEYNVTIVLEPLNSKECNFINSVTEGGEIVEEINHQNFKLLADIYHMKMEGESPESIVKYGHLIKHIHIAEKQERAVPGTFNEDFRPYFDALKKINYTGKMSIEAQWTDFETQIPLAIETIKKQFAD